MAFNVVTAKVVGVRPYSFVGSDGETVRMSQVFCEFSDRNTEGMACCSVNMSEKKLVTNLIGVNEDIHICLINKRWEYVNI